MTTETTPNILYNYIPSFYKDFLVDGNGNCLLDPLFDVFANAMGDAYYQALQIAMVPYLEQASPYFKETYKSIDTSFSNRYKNGYVLDSSIIFIDTLYLDALFTIAFTGTYEIYHDIANNVRYIVFYNLASQVIEIEQDCVFSKYCYNDLKTLQNTYGFLLKYNKSIPDYNLSATDLLINFTQITEDYVEYKNQLLAILYGRMTGPTIQTLNRLIGIFIGLPYSTVNGTIRTIDPNAKTIGIQDSKTGKIISFTLDSTASYHVGQIIEKYEILQSTQTYRLYDMFSDPARFTQFLIGNDSARLLALLTLDYSKQEQDASLYWDSVFGWDDTGLYWDMGNNTDASYSVPGSIVAPANISSFSSSNITQFDTWYDTRFDPATPTSILYEMFRNVTILEANFTITDDLKNVLNSLIPVYTKLIYLGI